jgi:ketopantoate hydroxymethyltransferase
MHLINLVQSRGTWRFNGALSCSSKTELIAVARELLRAGVRSQVLESVSAELLVSTH